MRCAKKQAPATSPTAPPLRSGTAEAFARITPTSTLPPPARSACRRATSAAISTRATPATPPVTCLVGLGTRLAEHGRGPQALRRTQLLPARRGPKLPGCCARPRCQSGRRLQKNGSQCAGRGISPTTIEVRALIYRVFRRQSRHHPSCGQSTAPHPVIADRRIEVRQAHHRSRHGPQQQPRPSKRCGFALQELFGELPNRHWSLEKTPPNRNTQRRGYSFGRTF